MRIAYSFIAKEKSTSIKQSLWYDCFLTSENCRDGITNLHQVLSGFICMNKMKKIIYLDKYGRAIDKWESDREFISEYKAGSYTRYGVGGIYRKY